MILEEILDYKLKSELKDKYETITTDDKTFILAQAKNKFQIYCHRPDVPEAANYVLCDIAIAVLKDLRPDLFDNQEDLENRVTSIKTGDTSINLEGDSSASEGAVDSDNDAFLNSFKSQLKTFRKISSGCGCDINGV